MRVGFIGMGSMGSAIALGLLDSGLVAGQDLVFSTHSGATKDHRVARAGARPADSNLQVAQQCDVLVIAVKPHQFAQVLDPLAPELASDTVLVSIAGGLTLADLQALAPRQPWVRVMPNVGAQVRQSATALVACDKVSPAQLSQVRGLFEALGTVFELPENLFSAFTPVAGCAPAWTFVYANALAEAALALGLPKQAGLQAAAQMLKGSAQLLERALEDGKNPLDLVTSVCSPGGSTIAGLLAGQDAGFAASTVKMVQAAAQKS